jgi:soluble lytic murein transglycosylase
MLINKHNIDCHTIVTCGSPRNTLIMDNMVNKWFINIGVTLVMVGTIALWPQPDRFARGVSFLPSLANLTGVKQQLPVILSQRDTSLYKQLFAAQSKADWTKADKFAANIKSDALMGHALAERYLDAKYKPKAAELTQWLANYSDHPEAFDIYNLALAKSPASAKTLENIQKPKQLATGYGTDSGNKIRFTNSGREQSWNAGLDAWRKGNKAEAAKIFVSVANSKDLTNWQQSAANFWAWRALDATGQASRAKQFLTRAAEDGRSFYSVLARRQLGDKVVDTSKIELSDTDVLGMIQEPAVRRAIALSQVGKNDLAERELAVAFPQADTDGKLRLLALANELHLASVQMSMARQLDNSGISMDFAHYPVPRYQPLDGFKIDPALIYAVARQESGFKIAATSPVGAQGLMQLMPGTAKMMKKDLNLIGEANAAEPAVNMMLGQNYVRHLLDHKMVDGNLIYMLTAYNAGAGHLQEWKQTLPANDPLLFVESIPLGETRAYVQQVMTNYWIYSELAGNNNSTITALAKGEWPSYDTSLPVAEIKTPQVNG